MGVNWAAGLIYWKPHVSSDGRRYGMSHVHPFRFAIHLEAHKGRPARDINVHVGFSMHVFTVKIAEAGSDPEFYSDDRETRAFNMDRYDWSHRLKSIVIGLEKRKCYFTSRSNYLTVDTDSSPTGRKYQLYFEVRRHNADSVELVVQSAFEPKKEDLYASMQKVRFRVIASEALLGKKAKPPP